MCVKNPKTKTIFKLTLLIGCSGEGEKKNKFTKKTSKRIQKKNSTTYSSFRNCPTGAGRRLSDGRLVFPSPLCLFSKRRPRKTSHRRATAGGCFVRTELFLLEENRFETKHVQQGKSLSFLATKSLRLFFRCLLLLKIFIFEKRKKKKKRISFGV